LLDHPHRDTNFHPTIAPVQLVSQNQLDSSFAGLDRSGMPQQTSQPMPLRLRQCPVFPLFSEPEMAILKPFVSVLVLVCLTATNLCSTAVAEPPSILRIFGKTPAAEAVSIDPKKLTEVDGPWMILAHSFAGADGRAEAEQLADQLSKELGIPTFIHEEDFDFTGKLEDKSNEGRVRRYANQTRYQAFAVLAGEYDSVDHPQLVKDLKRIKAAKPAVFSQAAASPATPEPETPLDAVRNIQKGLLAKVGKTAPGPMKNAFATTNPMLPQEYFLAPEVDSFVMELNSEVEHSLLDNPGKFTVVVATFAGLSAIDDGKKDKEFVPSSARMDKCAIQADTMVRELREQGVEAYQFHDRTSSMVTIGSFDSLGTNRPGGSFEYDAAIRNVMATYCAGNKVAQTKSGPGFAPKHVASIPFDVKPTPIAVPRKSKRSLYSGKFGMR